MRGLTNRGEVDRTAQLDDLPHYLGYIELIKNILKDFVIVYHVVLRGCIELDLHVTQGQPLC